MGPVLSLLLFSFTPEKTNRNHRLTKKKFPFTNPLIRSNLLLLFTCSLAVLPVCVCVCAQIFPPQRLQIRSMPQRITVTENHTHLFHTVNTSTHSILHIYTPCLLICSVLVCLFCFSLQGLCQAWFEISLTMPKPVSHNRTCRSLGGFGNMTKHCNRQPPP